MLGQVIVQVPPCGDRDRLSPGAGVGRGLCAPGVAPGWGLTVHEVEDEAELVGRVEGIGHAHDERAVLVGDAGSLSLSPVPVPCPAPVSPHPSADEGQHDAFVEGQRLALLHLDALLVQALHGVPGGRAQSPCSHHVPRAGPAPSSRPQL